MLYSVSLLLWHLPLGCFEAFRFAVLQQYRTS